MENETMTAQVKITQAGLTKSIKLVIRKTHPDMKGLKVEWAEPLRSITYPTGLKALRGRVTVTASGWEPRTAVVDARLDGRWFLDLSTLR